uniref:DUF7745 domain-containing protein n=1 Tax=Cajanus cajan TaxID=3821 RepID=A0A151UGP3_CAJCA
MYMGHYPSLTKVATSLGIDARELASKKVIKGGIEGFSRINLERCALNLAESEKWDAFMDVLSLIIYGIVLFPNFENFIDFAAINVFLAFKHEKKSLVPAILADTYHSLTLRHERRVICQCGDFLNVPLMGTKGCVNYNLALAIRQLGYPIRSPPVEDSITPFMVYDMTKELDFLKKIRHSWDRVMKKGRELGKRNCNVEGSYQQWLSERVQHVKLPFRGPIPIIEETPIQEPMSLEEIEKLQEKLAKSEKEKKDMKKELIQARQEYQAAQKEISQARQRVELANKRARIEEEGKLNTRNCLEAAFIELKMRRGERDQARVDGE